MSVVQRALREVVFEKRMNSSCLHDLQVNRATEVVAKDFARKLVTQSIYIYSGESCFLGINELDVKVWKYFRNVCL